MYSPEILTKIAIWRERAATGELTQDELKEWVTLRREGRMAAQQASDSAKRKKAKAVVLSAEELERELGIS